jgi:hypothetical protein
MREKKHEMKSGRLTIFPLWLNLDQNLLLPHNLHNLSDITSRLM